MTWYAKFDGVDGSSESRSAPNVSEIVVTKQTDGFGGMTQVSWGLDRIDQRPPAGDAYAGEFPGIVSLQDGGPFFAYGDGFHGGVEPEARVGGLIRLEIIYAPLGAPDHVDGLAVEVPGL